MPLYAPLTNVVTKDYLNKRAWKSQFAPSVTPNTYAYPPTITFSGPGGSIPIANTVRSPYNGQQISFAVNSASTGINTITTDSVSAAFVRRGMKVTHLVNPASSGVPAGTTVTSITGTTFTLSNAVTVADGDILGFGDPVVQFLGCQPGFNSQNSQNYTFNSGNGTWTAPPFAVEFDYYGTDFVLRYKDQAGAPQFWVWVDGQPTTAAPFGTSGVTNSAGSIFYMRCTFNNSNDNSLRWRRIRIYLYLSYYGGLEIGRTDAIAPSSAYYPKICFYGDSWVEGVIGAGYANNWMNSIPMMATHLLNLGVPLVAGQGGTGYVATGGVNKQAYSNSARLSSMYAYNPDILIVAGTINDSSNTATFPTNATATLTSMQQNLPNTKILVMGVQSRGGFSTSGDYTNNNALSTICTNLGIPFLDILNASWIVGSGRSGSTTGIGNADRFMGPDGAHLQQDGVEYYARRQANWIAANI